MGFAPLSRNTTDDNPTMRRRDAVSAELREAVIRRDGCCFIARIDPEHVCRDRWGYPHAATDDLLLTLEHVKSDLRIGRRAPSDLRHLVALCHGSNVAVPSKAQRALMRTYLLGLYPVEETA